MGRGGPKVLDISDGIPGAYAALLLHHAGATVARGEASGGDPMRRWRLAPGEPHGDGALYRYLRQGQTAVRMDAVPDDAAGADVLLASPDQAGAARLRAIAAGRPDLTIVAVTAFGLTGPLAHRPATDLTVQAESGALGIRGRPDEPPVQMGGRTVDWLAGAYAGVAAFVGWRGARAHGRGLFVDLARCDVANLGGCNFMDLMHAIGHGVDGAPVGPMRGWESPSIEPTADGWVGFNTNSPHHFEAFLRMLERPDLIETGEFNMAAMRSERREEWNEVIHAWTRRHTTEQVIERAVVEGVPVAPVSNGRTVLELDHAASRGAWVDAPDGDFRMPCRPWLVDGDRGPAPQPATRAPADRVPWADDAATGPGPPTEPARPWSAGGPAGPRPHRLVGGSGRHGCVRGARVRTSSTSRRPARMDHMRLVGALFFDRPQWWELSSFFLAINTNKRSLTLDLASDEGRRARARPHRPLRRRGGELHAAGARQARASAGTPSTRRTRGRCSCGCPPTGSTARGATGPGSRRRWSRRSAWRGSPAAPTTSPASSAGPCDPNGGVHAAFAALVALEQRERTGEGSLVEVAMFDTAIGDRGGTRHRVVGLRPPGRA